MALFLANAMSVTGTYWICLPKSQVGGQEGIARQDAKLGWGISKGLRNKEEAPYSLRAPG